ncbi:MAG: hypothetical protein JNJ54_15615 [Myxococcaceae bacterium]|nr:hypothetical protein [Myxococcaceae bacterium]
MTPWLLALLVVVDGTLCGFRAAAGRNPRLFLRAYYAASMRRAALLALVVAAGFLGVTMAVRAHDAEAFSAIVAAGEVMVLVYGVYATVVLLALGLYLLGHFDLGVLATVLVLGPFTLARPLVIVAGAAFAAWSSPHPAAVAFAVAGASAMLVFERLLDLGRPPWRGVLTAVHR